MAEFLSEAWIESLHRSVTAQVQAGALVAGVHLVVQQVVQRTESAEPVVYHLEVRDGAASLHPGPAAAPDVTFMLDQDTAEAIASGALSAQAAFMTGRLVLRGDALALVRNHPALSALAGLTTATEPERGPAVPGDA